MSGERSLEREVQNTVNGFVRDLRGAKFSVDLQTGKLKSIPFGTKGALVIRDRPDKNERAEILSPGYKSEERSQHAIGYFQSFSGGRKILSGLMMLEPLSEGYYRFRLIDLGEILFGYC
jgi:hypothetical protein